ncbi:hypothetical protein V6N13_003381 [Hibiscus sabdariffa]
MDDSCKKSVPLPDLDKEINIVKDLEGENLASDTPGHKDGEENVSGGDDASSISDISELVEERLEQLENERISRKAESNSGVTMKPLEVAEELEKKQPSTGLHWEEGAAAQPMRLEGVRVVQPRWDTLMLRLTIQSLGLFHHKHLDMVILGLQGDQSLAPVTSMCFNQPGDLLLVGYDDGHVTV